MSELAEFLAGERPDDVALYLSAAALDGEGRLRDAGEPAGDGAVLVVDGERGRRAFAAGTGLDAMEFARAAMGTDGRVAPDLAAGDCPDAAPGEGHAPEFVLAFAEEQNDEVGGPYAEGDVLHAYARCECGTAYSDRWVAGRRELPE